MKSRIAWRPLNEGQCDELHFQLLEEQRRHVELSRQLQESESLAERLSASEAERLQLQRSLDTALQERYVLILPHMRTSWRPRSNACTPLL